MLKTSSIDSLTNFQKNAKSFVSRLEQTQQPMVLTVNGKAKLVIQDADAYQGMLDELERARFVDAVRQGIHEADHGQGRPAEEVFAEMKDKYGL
jgi:PHD/YefM family antitoxin component YafN of YafNO toxin-antitoxin module